MRLAFFIVGLGVGVQITVMLVCIEHRHHGRYMSQDGFVELALLADLLLGLALGRYVSEVHHGAAIFHQRHRVQQKVLAVGHQFALRYLA